MIHSIYSQLYICISKSKFRRYFLYGWKFRIPISQILGPPLLPSRHNEELHSTTCVYCMYIYRQHKDACRKETSWQPNKSQQLPSITTGNDRDGECRGHSREVFVKCNTRCRPLGEQRFGKGGSVECQTSTYASFPVVHPSMWMWLRQRPNSFFWFNKEFNFCILWFCKSKCPFRKTIPMSPVQTAVGCHISKRWYGATVHLSWFELPIRCCSATYRLRCSKLARWSFIFQKSQLFRTNSDGDESYTKIVAFVETYASVVGTLFINSKCVSIGWCRRYILVIYKCKIGSLS